MPGLNELNPLPCLVCGAALTHACPDRMPREVVSNQPNDGVCFATHGNYGSTYFDSFDGRLLEIAVCDPCLVKHEDRTRELAPIGVARIGSTNTVNTHRG